MTVPTIVSRFLDAAGIGYSIDHHEPCYTAQDLAEEEAITGYRIAKSVVCFADDRPVILVLPAPLYVDLRTVSAELGADDVRLAEPDEIPGLFPEIGTELAPPPLPLWPNVKIHADESMAIDGDIMFAAGSAKDAVRVGVRDWVRLAKPSFGDFATTEDGGNVVTQLVILASQYAD